MITTHVSVLLARFRVSKQHFCYLPYDVWYDSMRAANPWLMFIVQKKCCVRVLLPSFTYDFVLNLKKWHPLHLFLFGLCDINDVDWAVWNSDIFGTVQWPSSSSHHLNENGCNGCHYHTRCVVSVPACVCDGPLFSCYHGNYTSVWCCLIWIRQAALLLSAFFKYLPCDV